MERKQSSFVSWSVSIKKVCVLGVCRGSQMCPFHRSFWYHARNTGIFKVKSLFQNHLPPAQNPISLTTHSRLDSNIPGGPFSPSMGAVRLWLSSSEPGGGCSSRGAHVLLVDLRMSLLLFSWSP